MAYIDVCGTVEQETEEWAQHEVAEDPHHEECSCELKDHSAFLYLVSILNKFHFELFLLMIYYCYA